MPKWSRLLRAALVTAVAACAGTPPPPPAPPVPPAVNPVGIFDFTTAVEGTVVNGTITVVKTDTGYGGAITTTATDPVPVRTVAVDGKKLTVTADTPDGPVVFTLEFKGDEFTGSWSLSTMAGTHTGKRRTT